MLKAEKLPSKGNRVHPVARMNAVVAVPVAQRMIERIVFAVCGLAFIPSNARKPKGIRQIIFV